MTTDVFDDVLEVLPELIDESVKAAFERRGDRYANGTVLSVDVTTAEVQLDEDEANTPVPVQLLAAVSIGDRVKVRISANGGAVVTGNGNAQIGPTARGVQPIATWSAPGAVQPTIGQIRQPVTGTATIQQVIVLLGSPPTAGGCTIDVKLNGVSIFPTTAPPTVAAGAFYAVAVPDTRAVSVGDYLTVDVLIPDGSDISVVVTAI